MIPDILRYGTSQNSLNSQRTKHSKLLAFTAFLGSFRTQFLPDSPPFASTMLKVHSANNYVNIWNQKLKQRAILLEMAQCDIIHGKILLLPNVAYILYDLVNVVIIICIYHFKCLYIMDVDIYQYARHYILSTLHLGPT